MEQSELVFSLVFDDNMKAFGSEKDITKDICRLFILTFPDLCKHNSTIMKVCNIYSSQFWYEKMHDNLVSIAIEKDKNNNCSEYQQKEEDILMSVWSSPSDIQIGFKNLLIAEYKEYIYLSLFERLHVIEKYILDEYERIITEWYNSDDIKFHSIDKFNILYNNSIYHHSKFF